MVAHTCWGADSSTLLKLYHCLMRSKLDYGCMVYGSARTSYLESLDRVQNAALRIYVFRTTPITSLCVEANKIPLTLRRQKLAVQSVLKLKSNPSNPTYTSVFQCNYRAVFEAKRNVIPTLSRRLRSLIVLKYR